MFLWASSGAGQIFNCLLPTLSLSYLTTGTPYTFIGDNDSNKMMVGIGSNMISLYNKSSYYTGTFYIYGFN